MPENLRVQGYFWYCLRSGFKRKKKREVSEKAGKSKKKLGVKLGKYNKKLKIINSGKGSAKWFKKKI